MFLLFRYAMKRCPVVVLVTSLSHFIGPRKLVISFLERDVITCTVFHFKQCSAILFFLPTAEQCVFYSVLGFLNTALWKPIQSPICCVLKHPRWQTLSTIMEILTVGYFLQSYSQHYGMCDWWSTCVKGWPTQHSMCSCYTSDDKSSPQ